MYPVIQYAKYFMEKAAPRLTSVISSTLWQ